MNSNNNGNSYPSSTMGQQQQQQQQQPEIISGVGASDTILLAVSIFGFIALAVSVYSIVIMRLKTAEEVSEDDQDMTYEERLARQTDVSKLNRAQRRARAKHIMKQQRRIAPTNLNINNAAPAVGGGDENNEDEDNNNNNDMQLANVDDNVDDNNNAVLGLPHHHPQQQHLSRKERQKAAKAQEKEERKLHEEDRKKQQLLAQEEAHREKLLKLKKNQEQIEKRRLERLKATQKEELSSYYKWKTFLASPNPNETISVKDWITKELSVERKVSLIELSKRFHTSTNVVRTRIQELIQELRLTGYFLIDDGDENDDDDDEPLFFVYVPKHELATLSSFIQTKDSVTLQDISKAYEEIILVKKDTT